MTPPPVSFTEKAKQTTKAGGYPVQISASDLDENFVFATLDIPERDENGNQSPWLVTEMTGPSGHRQRQLIFNPPPPSTGTHVLGVVDGVFQWIATEEC